MPLVSVLLEPRGSNDRTEQKVALYRRQFGKPSGAFFTFNTKWNAPMAMANTSATAA